MPYVRFHNWGMWGEVYVVMGSLGKNMELKLTPAKFLDILLDLDFCRFFLL